MSCPSGKLRYRDELAARLTLAAVRPRHERREKSEKRAYRCPACNGWHLTSKRR